MTDNIVLIVLDTVRKDFFDEFAPRLQSLSDVSFEQCRAASSTSVSSHASMFTGQLPHQHGIHSFNPDYKKLDRSDTFLGELPEHSALGVSANAFAGSAFGFDSVFDAFTDVSWTRRFPEGMDMKEFVMTSNSNGLSLYFDFLKTALHHDNTLKTFANAGLAQLDVLFSHLPLPRLVDDGATAALKEANQQVNQSAEPFFLFVNLMDAHTPHQHVWGYDRSLHDAPNNWSSLNDINQWDLMRNGIDDYEEDVEYFRQLYGASIEYLDRKVAKFIKDVRESTEKDTRFIITADHGENLGFESDRSLFGHKSSLTESLLHVPLYLVNPPVGYNEKETRYVSHLKLGKLVSGIAKSETPTVFADRIPAELVGTTSVPEMNEREQAYWRRMIRCVYEDEKKIVWDSLGECVSYKLNHSKPCWQMPRTEGNVSPPPWADQFFSDDIQTYKSRFESDTEIYDDVDDFTRERLEDLGYL